MLEALLEFAVRVYGRRWFLSRSTSPRDTRLRRDLIKRFQAIDRRVKCAHTPKEMYVMADFLLKMQSPGCIVECGCYFGGSSAKLSLLAAITGRELYVCDSFEGLPPVDRADGQFKTVDRLAVNFSKGEFSGTLATVRRNVERFGNPEVVHYIPGFFDKTLPGLQVQPVMVFADADLIDSTRSILRALWPRMVPGGRIFVHDMNLVGLVHGVTDGQWWLRELGVAPPAVFGAGYGCGLGAGALAFFENNERNAAGVSPEPVAGNSSVAC